LDHDCDGAPVAREPGGGRHIERDGEVADDLLDRGEVDERADLLGVVVEEEGREVDEGERDPDLADSDGGEVGVVDVGAQLPDSGGAGGRVDPGEYRLAVHGDEEDAPQPLLGRDGDRHLVEEPDHGEGQRLDGHGRAGDEHRLDHGDAVHHHRHPDLGGGGHAVGALGKLDTDNGHHDRRHHGRPTGHQGPEEEQGRKAHHGALMHGRPPRRWRRRCPRRRGLHHHGNTEDPAYGTHQNAHQGATTAPSLDCWWW
jgi:hypothetical protein